MAEQTRTIGYICPVCGKAVVVERTAFQLTAANSVLPCPCGKSELTITQLGDRCEITVPCLFCARDHRTTCSNEALLGQKLLSLSCSASGLDCCYVGEEGPVYAATARLEQALDRVDENAEERGTFLNPIVMEEVLSEIKIQSDLYCPLPILPLS